MKKLIALFMCILLCLAPATIFIMAASNAADNVNGCSHPSADCTIVEYGERTDVRPIGEKYRCCYFEYAFAKLKCNTCGLIYTNTVLSFHGSHTWVNSPSCVYCGYQYFEE